MHFTTQQDLGDLVERRFLADDIPGILWTPGSASSTQQTPLVLAGQPGPLGLDVTYPRIVARAKEAATWLRHCDVGVAGRRGPFPTEWC
jgi:hypothetical protein